MNLDQTGVVCALGQIVSPQLVAANHILAVSSAELQDLINREVAANPAIELEEHPICWQCGRLLEDISCPSCRPLAARGARVDSAARHGDGPTEEGPERRDPACCDPGDSDEEDEDADPLMAVPAPVSVAEDLIRSLQADLPAEDGPIVAFVVASLDENGRLSCTAEEVAELFDVDPDRARRAIRQLQDLEPVGIGARDLHECLLIQLSALERSGRSQPLARAIIRDFLPQLAAGKYAPIAAALGTTTATVKQIREFIRQNLYPFPTRGYQGAHLSGGGAQAASNVLPDVIISRTMGPDAQSSYDIDVVESRRFELRLDPSYARLYADMGSPQAGLSLDERRHIQQCVSRAKLFISTINQRRLTLSKITRTLVNAQRDVLDGRAHRFHPMTRAQLASDLCMHTSTISRAISEKTVLLPSGRIIPFSDFFVAHFPVKDAIRELISQETAPLSDREVVAVLGALGIHVARRTVARYRAQFGPQPAPRPTGNQCAETLSPSYVRALSVLSALRAQARARALLDELLDETERMQLARRGYLQVTSHTRRGRFYRIPAHGGLVRVYEQGRVVSKLCVGPVQPLPSPDVILLHKLLIEADEEAYLATANHFPVGRS